MVQTASKHNCLTTVLTVLRSHTISAPFSPLQINSVPLPVLFLVFIKCTWHCQPDDPEDICFPVAVHNHTRGS